ncbi:hypothetical protein MLD38_002072 [Melastoma candidum]|uniref:Uncharacterized protein n=1 Tax=Melastoma candidum TaxID=119954 RepID=A0ACB9SNW3_9MYRT|nr:hypothetical protein MLD38_002072 [Melastoma candidum]
MKVPVTGATGFLGGKLYTTLLNQRHDVRALGAASDGIDLNGWGMWICEGGVYVVIVRAGPDGCIGDESQAHREKVFCAEYGKSKLMADKIACRAASDGLPLASLYPGVIFMALGSHSRKCSGQLDDRKLHLVAARGTIAEMLKGRPGERYPLTGENATFILLFDMAALITGTSHKPKWHMDGYRFPVSPASQESSFSSALRSPVSSSFPPRSLWFPPSPRDWLDVLASSPRCGSRRSMRRDCRFGFCSRLCLGFSLRGSSD